MKKLLAITLSLSASALLAQTIEATKVNADLMSIKCADDVMKQKHGKMKFTDVVVYPQTTIKMNDKNAVAKNKANKARKVKVAALYDGKNVAIITKWSDKTKSIQKGYKSDVYPDGFAVQFATAFDDPNKLPYIGMGSKDRAVQIFLKKAVERYYEPNGKHDVGMQQADHSKNKFGKELEIYHKNVENIGSTDYTKAFIAEGFRSTTEIKDGSAKTNTDMKYMAKKSGWGGLVVRPVSDEYANLDKGAFPVAVAIWDGEELQRDGLKRLSGWVSVKLPTKGGEALVDALNQKVTGDVAKGKEVADTNCAACHQYGDTPMAPDFMAPNLSNIGGQATAGYIRESIVEPNAVVVPGYNRNQHPNMQWYMADEKGNRTSTMPAFDWLDKESQDNLIAYMQTLKAEVE